MESEYMCPLLNRIIDDAYCYEINNVVYGLIKPEILEDKINREEAREICDNCKYNQMK
jgi:hypothetical protein